MKIVLMSILVLLGSCNDKKPVNTGLEGKPMPSFNLILLDNKSVINTTDIPSGQPLVFFLFSPHCPYSKKQMDNIMANINELKNVHIYIITPFPYNDMKTAYEKYQIPEHQSLTMAIDQNNFFGHFMGAYGFPYLAIYDKKKVLVKAFLGETDSQIIKRFAEK